MDKIRVAIYGLGQETGKRIADLSSKYNIVGLLDSYQTSGSMFGYNVMSLNDALARRVERIIVVARPGSCRAIAKNISWICVENNVELIDIRGKNLLEAHEEKFDLNGISGYTKQELLERIDSVSVVSFDLFDTLIMRQIYNHEVLAELIGEKLVGKKVDASNLAFKRMQSEIQLSKNTIPDLKEIYSDIFPEESSDFIDEMVSLELEEDIKSLIPRREMVEVLSLAKENGKKIFITTDTYYHEDQIKKIVDSCGIKETVHILTSCDNKTSKSQNLFSVLKKAAQTDDILHIGDDLVADYESARNNGLEAFKIYSALDLYEMLGTLGLEKRACGLSDKIKQGMFISRLFNSPFSFAREGQIGISSLEDIGYLLIAPMISDFVLWISERIHKENVDNILFSARDCYLLQKMYEHIWPKENAFYFLTSRIAMFRACTENVADIEFAESTKFTGSLEDKLKVRYGISDCAVTGDGGDIFDYSELLFENSKIKKENYFKYIDKNILLKGGSTVFVDLSARGTIQYFVERMMKISMKGLYFLQLEPEFARNKNLNIIPFYMDDGIMNNVVFDDFYILEPIISAPDSSLDEFDENGEAVFAIEQRSLDEIEVMKRIQTGIMEYWKNLTGICPIKMLEINRDLDGAIFNLIHHLNIWDEKFFLLKNIDPFVNRVTELDVEV